MLKNTPRILPAIIALSGFSIGNSAKELHAAEPQPSLQRKAARDDISFGTKNYVVTNVIIDGVDILAFTHRSSVDRTPRVQISDNKIVIGDIMDLKAIQRDLRSSVEYAVRADRKIHSKEGEVFYLLRKGKIIEGLERAIFLADRHSVHSQFLVRIKEPYYRINDAIEYLNQTENRHQLP